MSFNTIEYCLEKNIPSFSFDMDYTKRPNINWSSINKNNMNQYVKKEKNGFAILTGPEFLVLDIDLKHKVSQQIQDDIMNQCCAIEKTPGGFHCWFRNDMRTNHMKSRTNITWDGISTEGLDIRAKGGICYVAPSHYTDMNGETKVYKWIKGDLTTVKTIPSEILEKIIYSDIDSQNPQSIAPSIMDEEFIIEHFEENGEKKLKLTTRLRNCLVDKESTHSQSRHSCIFITKGKSKFSGHVNCFSHGKKKLESEEMIDYIKTYWPECVAENSENGNYIAMKEEWEQTRFYLMSQGCIVEIKENYDFDFLTIERAKTNYGNTHRILQLADDKYHSVDFLSRWLRDPERKTYENITMINTYEPKSYSIFQGFSFERIPTILDNDLKKRVFTRFMDIIDHITNRNKKTKEYLLFWFAHMLQKPFENPLTCIIITGKQGCGKDMIGQFIGKYVIGEYLYVDYDNPLDFWEKHDLGRQGKLFIHCEESIGWLNKKFSSLFKARITSATMTLNPKGLNKYTTKNHCHYYLTTNDPEPVKCEESDRRYVIIPSGSWYVSNNEFWKETASILNCVEAGKIIGDYLMSLDISKFCPQTIPQNDYKDLLIETNKKPEDLFIEQWKGVSKTADELYDEYKKFCGKMEIIEIKTKLGLGKSLAVYIRDEKLYKKCDNTNTLYSITPFK